MVAVGLDLVEFRGLTRGKRGQVGTAVRGVPEMLGSGSVEGQF